MTWLEEHARKRVRGDDVAEALGEKESDTR